MLQIANEILLKELKQKKRRITGKGDLTSEDLKILLAGSKIKLDCGHYCTIGHNFSDTLIIHSTGGGKM